MFAAPLGAVAAQAVQTVWALVMSLLITSPSAVVEALVAAIATSVVFAEVSAAGGILLSLAPESRCRCSWPLISFVIYLIVGCSGGAAN